MFARLLVVVLEKSEYGVACGSGCVDCIANLDSGSLFMSNYIHEVKQILLGVNSVN